MLSAKFILFSSDQKNLIDFMKSCREDTLFSNLLTLLLAITSEVNRLHQQGQAHGKLMPYHLVIIKKNADILCEGKGFSQSTVTNIKTDISALAQIILDILKALRIDYKNTILSSWLDHAIGSDSQDGPTLLDLIHILNARLAQADLFKAVLPEIKQRQQGITIQKYIQYIWYNYMEIYSLFSSNENLINDLEETINKLKTNPPLLCRPRELIEAFIEQVNAEVEKKMAQATLKIKY